MSGLMCEGIRMHAQCAAAAAAGRPLPSVVLEFPALHSPVTAQDKCEMPFCWRKCVEDSRGHS